MTAVKGDAGASNSYPTSGRSAAGQDRREAATITQAPGRFSNDEWLQWLGDLFLEVAILVEQEPTSLPSLSHWFRATGDFCKAGAYLVEQAKMSYEQALRCHDDFQVLEMVYASSLRSTRAAS
jgi:hypothetical protein